MITPLESTGAVTRGGHSPDSLRNERGFRRQLNCTAAGSGQPSPPGGPSNEVSGGVSVGRLPSRAMKVVLYLKLLLKILFLYVTNHTG